MRNATDPARLFVVSRDSAMLRTLLLIGASNDWRFESATNAWEAMERLQSGPTPDLLLLDLLKGDDGGLYILRWLHRLRPALPIVLFGHPNDVGKEEEAIRVGARAYLVKPVNERHIELVVRKHLVPTYVTSETDTSSDEVESIGDGRFFVGKSPTMKALRVQAALLAEANVPVLILGESGSGKETIARLLHKLSIRSRFEFAKVNCAALPSDLLERELFGYHQGGACLPSQAGKLETCTKGTILLDEITEMSMDLQRRLLQVLQSRRFTRSRTSTSVEVDVRILASSSWKMERAISEHRLREDLYYRLNAYAIHVPPLRDRREEVPFLSHHFMHRLAEQYGLSPREISMETIDACQQYLWPGNLRELEAFVTRYLVLGGTEIPFDESRTKLHEVNRSADLTSPQTAHLAALPTVHSRSVAAPMSLKSLVESVTLEAEKSAIAAALEKTNWNRKAAARLLNVSYRTLLYKIARYQMRASDSSVYQFPGRSRTRRNGVRVRANGRTD